MAIDEGYTITPLSGKNGTNGQSLSVEYSVNGSTNWHSTFTNGDIYMRQSTDGGTTWSSAMKIVGEDGKNAITMTSATTPSGEYEGQIGVWQGQIYKWTSNAWVIQNGDLPTDAVLHYSFDEVPDYPDGTADYRFINNNTYSIFSSPSSGVVKNLFNATFSNNNGNLQVDLAERTDGQAGFYFYVDYTRNKTIKIQLEITNLSNNGEVYIENGKNNRIAEYNKNGVYEITFKGVGTGTYPSVFFIVEQNVSCNITFKKIYIGDGSYSTPIIDNANGQFNATNNGGIAVQGVSGKGAYFLNGKYADIGTDFQFNDNFSVSLWVKPENNIVNKRNILIGKSSSFLLFNGANGDNNLILYLYKNNNSNRYRLKQGLLTPNTWSFVVITKNQTELKCYINGLLVTTTTCVDTIDTNQNILRIGFSTNERSDTKDDLLIFNRALSDTEVQALYQNKANTPKYYTMSDYSLDAIDDDKVIDHLTEKPQLLSRWLEIYNAKNVTSALPTSSISATGEYKGLIDDASTVGVLSTDEVQAYITASNALRSAFWNTTNGYLRNMDVDSAVRTDINLDSLFATYRQTLQIARTVISEQQASVASALTVVNSNPFCLIPVNAGGTVMTYDNTGTRLQLFNGTTILEPVASSATLTEGKWKVTATGTDVVAGSQTVVSTSSDKYIDFGNVSALNADTASIQYKISVLLNGTTNYLYATQKFGKSKEGADGRIYSLETDNGVVKKSADGSTLTPSSVTVKAYSWTGSASPSLYSSGDLKAFENDVQIGSTVSQGNTITVSPTGSYPVVVKLFVHGTNTLLDTLTIPVLQEVKGDTGRGLVSSADYYKLSANVSETFDSTTISTWTASASSSPTAQNPYLHHAVLQTYSEEPLNEYGDDVIIREYVTNGTNTWYSSVSATTSTTSIALSTITSVAGHSVAVGDLIIANSLVFLVSAVGSTNATVSYKQSIKGDNSVTYEIDCPIVFKKGNAVTFTFYKVESGTRTAATVYARWYYTTDGSTWGEGTGSKVTATSLTTPTLDESIKVRCYIYANRSATTALDVEYSSLVTDGTNGTNGTNGVDATNVYLGNENITLACDKDGKLKSAFSTTVKVGAYKGTGRVASTITSNSNSSNVTVGTITNGTTSADGSVPLTMAASTAATAGELVLKVVANSITFYKTVTISIAKDGNTGAAASQIGENLLHDSKLFGSVYGSSYPYYININKGTKTANVFNGFTQTYCDNSSGSSTKDFLNWSNIKGFSLGDKYTLSFWAKGSGKIYIYWYGASGYVTTKRTASSDGQSAGSFGDGSTTFTLTSDWKQYWVTWQLNSSGDNTITKYILFRAYTGAQVYIAGPKFEKGATATAWLPHVDEYKGAKGDTPPVYTCELSMTALNSAVSMNVYKDGVACTETLYYTDWYAEGSTSATSGRSRTDSRSSNPKTLSAVNANKHLVRIYKDSNRTNLLCTGYVSYGSTGANSSSYWLITDASSINCDTEGNFTPASITLTAKSKTGSGSPENYSGRFKIEVSTDGSTYTTKYTSSAEEETKTYRIPASTKSIKCSLFLDGGISTLLDQDIITVTADGEKGDKGDRGFSSRTIAFRVNYSDFSTQSNGEVYVCGYNAEGAEANTYGYVIVNGVTYYTQGKLDSNCAMNGYMAIQKSGATSSDSPARPVYVFEDGSNTWYQVANDLSTPVKSAISAKSDWIVLAKVYSQTSEGKVSLEPMTPCLLSDINSVIEMKYEGIVAAVTNYTSAQITPYKITGSNGSFSKPVLTARYVERGALVLNTNAVTPTSSTAQVKMMLFDGTTWTEITSSDARYNDAVMLCAGVLPSLAGYYYTLGLATPNICGTYIDTLTTNRAFINEAMINLIRAYDINFKNSVSSYKDSGYVAGDLAISMGKNPKNDSDTDLNFNILSYKTTLQNKEIWNKEFHTKLEDGDINIKINGNLDLVGDISSFSPNLYIGADISNITTSGSGISLSQSNSAYVYLNGYIYLFQSSSSSTLLISKAQYLKDLTFTKITELTAIGLVYDAILYKNDIYISTSNGVYKFNASNNSITTITTTYKPVYLAEIDGLLNISSTVSGENNFAFYDGTQIIKKSAGNGSIYCLSKFSDDIYTSCNIDTTITGGSYTYGFVCFYDKNFNYLGYKELQGKSVLWSDGTTKVVSMTTSIFSAKGKLFTMIKAEDDNYFKLAVSKDGGDSWTVFTSDEGMLSFRFYNYKNVIVIKDEAAYYYSLDGGKTFSSENKNSYSSARNGSPFLIKDTYFQDILIPIAKSFAVTFDRIRQINVAKNSVIAYNFSTTSSYIVFANGLKIQWLKYQDGFTMNTVKDNLYLPLPFTSPSTCEIIGYYDNSSGTMAFSAVSARLYGNNTNRFKAITNGGQYSFFAIGY